MAERAVMGALDVGLIKAHLGRKTKVRDLCLWGRFAGLGRLEGLEE